MFQEVRRRDRGRLGYFCSSLSRCGFAFIPAVATASVGQPALTAPALRGFWLHRPPLAAAGRRVVTTPRCRSPWGAALSCVFHPALPVINSPLIYLSLSPWAALSCQGPDGCSLTGGHSVSTTVGQKPVWLQNRGLSRGIPTMILSGKFCYYSHFTGEETEIQRREDTCQGSRS